MFLPLNLLKSRFRSKYHPDEAPQLLAERRARWKKRLEVYQQLEAKGLIDSVNIDVERSDQITKVLDAAVILLEGGTELDLKSLDDDFVEEKSKEPDLGLFSVDVEKAKPDPQKESKPSKEPMEEGEESSDGVDQQEEEKTKPLSEEEIKKEDGEEDETPDKQKNGENVDVEEEVKQPKPDQEVPEESKPKEEDKNEEPQPRPLHKTTSIFLRNLAPNITKQEVEAVCVPARFPSRFDLIIHLSLISDH